MLYWFVIFSVKSFIMSDKKRRQTRVLTNVANETANLNNSKLQEENGYRRSPRYGRRSNGKENKFSVDIDPEIKSKDSDEGIENHRKILGAHCSEIISTGTPKMANVAVQCNIISNGMVLNDLIKECAKFNIEDVAEEFKLVILQCKQLQTKYGNDISPLSMRRRINNGNDKVTGIQLYQDEVNVTSSMQNPNSPRNLRNSDDSSERIDIIEIIDTLDKENYRSNKCDATNQVTKPANNGKGKSKTITYKTVNTRKYETRSKKTNSNHKTQDPNKDLPSTSTASNNYGRRLRKRPNPESITTISTKRVKNEIHEIVESITFKTNVRRSKKRSKKLPPLTLEYLAEKIQNEKIGILLPKRKTKSMGKNWIKFKNIIKPRAIPVPLTNCNSRPSQITQKLRRLYSPTEWMLSQEFSTLVEPEVKRSPPCVFNIH